MKIWAGVDPGEKRLGIARSDPLAILARPMSVAGSPEELITQLREWEDAGELEGVVVGMPRNMDGSYGPMARRSMALVTRIRSEISAKVRLWDERLTTQQVMRARGVTSKAEVSDAEVAALILQSYLDAGRPPAPDPPELVET